MMATQTGMDANLRDRGINVRNGLTGTNNVEDGQDQSTGVQY